MPTRSNDAQQKSGLPSPNTGGRHRRPARKATAGRFLSRASGLAPALLVTLLGCSDGDGTPPAAAPAGGSSTGGGEAGAAPASAGAGAASGAGARTTTTEGGGGTQGVAGANDSGAGPRTAGTRAAGSAGTAGGGTSGAAGGTAGSAGAAATGDGGSTPAGRPYAHVVAVEVSGTPGNYRFNVSVESADIDCTQYANWWEVLDEDGALIYRRILQHSHTDENGTSDPNAPGNTFTRDGAPVAVAADQVVIVRAHMSVGGYNGRAMRGSVTAGFAEATDIGSDFAAGVEGVDPQPAGCQF